VPGTFSYTPAAGSILGAGLGQTLSATLTPTDTVDYNSVTQTVSIDVLKATANITLGNLIQSYSGSPESATATTDATGTSSFSFTYNGSSTPPTVAGSYTVVATLNNDNYQGTATGTLVIGKATPMITWANPADITYGTPLGASQLDASSTTGGSFVYTPAAGTILNAGSGQTLSATFIPTDASDYTSVIGIKRTINVAQAPLTITSNNASMVRGTAIPALSVNYSGFVNGDTPANLASQPTIKTPATSLGLPGIYPIAANGASSANYAIKYEKGALVVAPAPVKILGISVHTIRSGKSKNATEKFVIQFSEKLNGRWVRGSKVLLWQPIAEARNKEAKRLWRSIMTALQEWHPPVHKPIVHAKPEIRHPVLHKKR
jgi:hypothetical protein